MYLGKSMTKKFGSCGGVVDSLYKMDIISPREQLTCLAQTQRLEFSITFWASDKNKIRSSCYSSKEMLEYVLSSSTMDLATRVIRDFKNFLIVKTMTKLVILLKIDNNQIER